MNFVILYYEVDFKMPIILGTAFMSTVARWSTWRWELRFRVNNEEVTFNIQRNMNYPTDMRVVSVTYFIDDHRGYFFWYLHKFLVVRVPVSYHNVKPTIAWEATHGIVSEV